MKKCVAAAVCLVAAVPNALENDVQPEFIIEKPPENVRNAFLRISMPFDSTTREIGYEITRAESHFRNICNTDGCRYGIGPMQIVRSTFKEQCEGDVFNTEDNITCGLTMLERGHYWRWQQSVDKWFPKLSKKARKKIIP